MYQSTLVYKKGVCVMGQLGRGGGPKNQGFMAPSLVCLGFSSSMSGRFPSTCLCSCCAFYPESSILRYPTAHSLSTWDHGEAFLDQSSKGMLCHSPFPNSLSFPHSPPHYLPCLHVSKFCLCPPLECNKFLVAMILFCYCYLPSAKHCVWSMVGKRRGLEHIT